MNNQYLAGNLFDQAKAVIAHNQPLMIVKRIEGGIEMLGTFLVNPVMEEHFENGPITDYEIIIHFSEKFPLKEPIVEEVGGKVKRDLEHHVFSSGKCCICVWEAWALRAGKHITIQKYFDTPLRNYFLSQFLYSKGEGWPFGEESHDRAGLEGLIYAYANLLPCGPTEKEVRAWLSILSKRNPKSNSTCPCGCGKAVVECYGPLQFLRLKNMIKYNFAKQMLEKMNHIASLERLSIL